jgi:hypothetical protein
MLRLISFFNESDGRFVHSFLNIQVLFLNKLYFQVRFSFYFHKNSKIQIIVTHLKVFLIGCMLTCLFVLLTFWAHLRRALKTVIYKLLEEVGYLADYHLPGKFPWNFKLPPCHLSFNCKVLVLKLWILALYSRVSNPGLLLEFRLSTFLGFNFIKILPSYKILFQACLKFIARFLGVTATAGT